MKRLLVAMLLPFHFILLPSYFILVCGGGMLANYGYRDGSGEFFITIDTDKCNGCAECVRVCPAHMLQVGEDENDPLNENPVASVVRDQRKKIKYSCGHCKPAQEYRMTDLPCVKACSPGAIAHSW